MSSGTAASAEERAAAQRVAAVRWPDGARCPYCDSERVSERNRPERRWPQWRCRDCRKDFTAVTGTAFSRTRRAPSDIEHLLAAGRLVPQLVPPAPERDQHERSRHASLAAHPGPSTGLSSGALAVMDALRRRPSGATLRKIAELAELSPRHSHRCLTTLAARGICQQQHGTVADGHRVVTVPLWRLTFSPECFASLGEMPRLAPRGTAPSATGSVPHRFWGMFWSGATGPDLRLDEDGCHIAGSLIGSSSVAAECWALRNADTDSLAELRQLRGFDEGDIALAIDAELERRGRAAAG